MKKTYLKQSGRTSSIILTIAIVVILFFIGVCNSEAQGLNSSVTKAKAIVPKN